MSSYLIALIAFIAIATLIFAITRIRIAKEMERARVALEQEQRVRKAWHAQNCDAQRIILTDPNWTDLDRKAFAWLRARAGKTLRLEYRSDDRHEPRMKSSWTVVLPSADNVHPDKSDYGKSVPTVTWSIPFSADGSRKLTLPLYRGTKLEIDGDTMRYIKPDWHFGGPLESEVVEDGWIYYSFTDPQRSANS